VLPQAAIINRHGTMTKTFLILPQRSPDEPAIFSPPHNGQPFGCHSANLSEAPGIGEPEMQPERRPSGTPPSLDPFQPS
jgi:hypothetical protein